MTDRPKVVIVKLSKAEMDILFAEELLSQQECREAGKLTEGALKVSWECLNWAKAQMKFRPN